MAKQDPLLAKTNTDTYLGFDFGTKKIGAAVGQSTTGTASPLQTIRSINQNPN
ncbi:MAG: Holliday junction resolvase RuvX, partial [Methylobacter sp.]